MPKSYTPNWFFTALLDNHINQMMARYSCLLTLSGQPAGCSSFLTDSSFHSHCL
ncbi:endo-1,4-beta-xylanase [Escherichia coli]|nr:endo-1,4-beta-xylanase [Escherichia coli]